MILHAVISFLFALLVWYLYLFEHPVDYYWAFVVSMFAYSAIFCVIGILRENL